MKQIITITDKDITGSDMLSQAVPRIAVNGILYDENGKIALSYVGKYDFYTLPGGGVESGEDKHSALRREMLEETGCECEVIEELGMIFENRYQHDFTQKRYYYFARVIGNKGSLNLTLEEIEENTSVFWCYPEEAFKIISERSLENYQRKFIQKRDLAVLEKVLISKVLSSIPGGEDFIRIEPVLKGWSDDKKYFIDTADKKLFLRISDISEIDRKKTEYEMMKKAWEHGIMTSEPFRFGMTRNGGNVFSISGRLEGEDLEIALEQMPEKEQYICGIKAGKVLNKMHAVPIMDLKEPWDVRFYNKVQSRIRFYERNVNSSINAEVIVKYLIENGNLISKRPQTFVHGDFNISNLMIMENGEIGVLDFNAFNNDHSDPWWEFDSIPWGSEPSPYYYTGLINGYFQGRPPEQFFKVLSYYLAYDALAALCDTHNNIQGAPEDGIRHMENILKWFDNMNDHIPVWYLETPY